MTEALSLKSRVPLSCGTAMPIIGLGVWQMQEGEETRSAVRIALEAGYRHIDTAKLYGNEKNVGEAVRESGIPREEIFIATKLWPADAFNVEDAFERSFKKLNLQYVDLYLIHAPVPFMSGRIWKKMEKLYEQKVARAIGVSNYGIGQLQEILGSAHTPPAVNQVRFNPFAYKKELLEFCNKNNIVLEAYSPLTQGRNLQDELIVRTARTYNKTPAQILLRFAVQKGVPVIPKSSRRERIYENADIFDFELTPDDMVALDNLS